MAQSKQPRLIKLEVLVDHGLFDEIEQWRERLPVMPHRAAALRALIKLGLKTQSGGAPRSTSAARKEVRN